MKKSNNKNSLPVTFNNAKVVTCSTHKHLGLLLDKRLSFNEHIQSKMEQMLQDDWSHQKIICKSAPRCATEDL